MNDVLDLFRKTGALLQGHFVLRSGLHSRQFFQCALLLQDARAAAHVCGLLAEKLRPFKAATVISPAIGGIIVGQEIARHLGLRHIFAEKDGCGRPCPPAWIYDRGGRDVFGRRGRRYPRRTPARDHSDRAKTWRDRGRGRFDR